MRVSDIIGENWDRTVPTRGGPVDLYRDPSRAELTKLLHLHGILRAFLDRDGTLFVWDSYAATHGDVEDDTSLGGSVILNRSGVELNHLEDFRPGKPQAGKLRSVVEALGANPSLQRFYGQGFVPRGVWADRNQYYGLSPAWLDANVDPDGTFHAGDLGPGLLGSAR